MKQTRKELETNLAYYRNQADMLSRALNDALRGDTVWFGEHGRRVGLCRPTAPDGGLVIVQGGNPPYYAVYHLDRWAESPHFRHPSDQEDWDYLEALNDALCERARAIEVERQARSAREAAHE